MSPSLTDAENKGESEYNRQRKTGGIRGDRRQTYSDNSRFTPPQEFWQFGDGERDLDQALQTLTRLLLVLALFLGVPLDVHAHGGALAAGAAEAEDDTRAVAELDDVPLILGDASVDGVGVGEVGDGGDGEGAAGGGRRVRGGDEVGCGEERIEMRDECGGALGGDFFVVVSVYAYEDDGRRERLK